MRWRALLIDGPAHITEVAIVWYRLYSIALLWIVALTVPAVTLATLILWFGFGVRWGW